jgi:predicted Rossmann-fold nucleotide-binding protein
MKITVYGGGYKQLTKREIAECRKLGKFLADAKIETLTGGGGRPGRGYAYEVGNAAVLGGGRVFGQSPAINEQEHTEKYNFALDGVTDMIYMDKLYDNRAEGLVSRMNKMQPFSDVVIALGGNWGTFYELILSLYYNKTIILVNEFGGAVEAFQWAHKFFGERDFNKVVHEGCTLVPVQDIDEAIFEIKKLKSKYDKFKDTF